MNFTLDASGAQHVGEGIGSVFKALALAPMYRQQAEQETALKLARIYQANMAGNKSGIEAENLGLTIAARKRPIDNTAPEWQRRTQQAFADTGDTNMQRYSQAADNFYTLGQRDGVDQQLSADPKMAPYTANLLRVFKLTGDTNADRLAKAGSEFQGQGMRDDAAALARSGNVEAMNRLLSVASEKPYLPFDNVGNSGYSINKATGAQSNANAVLAKLFGDVQQSIINENNAQAGAAGALRDQRRYELGAAKGQGGDGTPVSSGKALTNAQLRANQDIEAARQSVRDLPRETIAAILRKGSLDLTEQDKDILARIKKARTAKYGEAGVPGEFNDTLGLDQKVVEQVANAIKNPGSKQAGAIARLFGASDTPMTEQEAIDAVVAALPDSEKANKAQYVAAGREKARNKNSSSASSVSTIDNPFTPSAEMLQVQADFKAGRISKDEARKKLKALGMQE